MACPYFEPQRAVVPAGQARARLPLIEEQDGLCRAGAEAAAVSDERRFRCCNHGYSQGVCEILPAGAARSSFRYTVVKQSAAALDILCIEEEEYTPRRWHAAQYATESGSLTPELENSCMRAQALAFCRSYLRHFPVVA